MEIIGVIVAGIIIGLLGKFVAPGDKDNIPIWLTVLCGFGGVIIGWFIYSAFVGNGSAGVDWTRWIVAVLVAAVLVVVASGLTGRNRSRRNLLR
ncbi:MAG: GlsB/YeaQ/YmgE family stress response membrane protein [Propionibacteriales bacterium]|nr:GlsB/YeaQ/YmgE family stress response membrane protein [Propionibacteriales bacterium]